MKFAENISQINSSTRNCIPINVSKGKLTLLWPSHTAQDLQEDTEDYSCTPLEGVEALLADVSARAIGDTLNTDEFAWWLGGVVPKGSMKPIYRAIEAVDVNVRQRLRHENHILFIYDLVPMTTPLKDLRFVLDAGRQPLRSVADETFQATYGLDKTLTFKRAEPREGKPSDLWESLY